jgi:hypothetical protein
MLGALRRRTLKPLEVPEPQVAAMTEQAAEQTAHVIVVDDRADAGKSEIHLADAAETHLLE